jgi:hypothetical protein
MTHYTRTSLHAISVLGLALAGCGDDGDAPVPLVSATTLDFGQTDCGTTQVSRTLVLANPTFTLMHYTAELAHGTQYMVQPPSGFVLPGQQLAVTIFSAKIPAVSPTTDNFYGDTLTITTDIEGDAPHVIDVRQTAHGAILTWGADSVAFPGTSKATDKATVPLALRNEGNAPAIDVTMRGTGGFAFEPAVTASLPPGELAGAATYRATVEGDEPGTLAVVSANGVLCAPLPAPISTTAKGTFAGATPIEVDLISGASGGTNRAALFARFADGRVASLGDNDFGLRGANTSDPPVTPTIVRDVDGVAVDDVADLEGARAAACALRTDHDLLCWGNVGLARADARETTPPQLAATKIAAGVTAVGLTYAARCINANGHTSCITNTGNHPTNASTWTPTDVTQLSLHAGGGYGLRADGSVVSFGTNVVGERGDPAATTSVAPIPGLTDVKKALAMSGLPRDPDTRGGCALKADGTVWCWGSGADGRIGDGAGADRDVPVQVMIDATTPLEAVRDIAGTDQFRCAVTPDNLYCWGEIPDVGESAWAQPVAPDPITDGTSITSSWTGACVLRSAGLITCFGDTPFSSGPLTDYTGFMAPTP